MVEALHKTPSCIGLKQRHHLMPRIVQLTLDVQYSKRNTIISTRKDYAKR